MKCSEAGCESEAKKRGLCEAHYSLFYRLGTLEEHATKAGRGPYAREKTCSGVAECGKKHCAQGFCSPCYQAKKVKGEIFNKPPVNAGNICSVEGCEKEARTKGLCVAHYEKFLKYGDPLAYAPKRTGNACSTEGCDGVSIARGLCKKCYRAWRAHGDPTKRSEQFLKYHQDLVDDQGYVSAYAPGHPNANKANRLPKHRLIMSDFLGRPLRANENVHHINGVKTDNRIENLELWVTTQPKGQRPQDLVAHAKKILKIYAGEEAKLKRLQYRNK